VARNVGSIEVTVDANTGKLKAQITRAGEEAGKAGGKAIEEGLSDVDGRELIAKLKKIKAQAERALSGVEIDIGVDKAKALADIRELEQRLRAAQLEMHVEPDLRTVGLEAEIARMRQRLLNDLDLTVEGKLNDKRLLADAEKAKHLMETVLSRVEARVEIAIDKNQTNAQLTALHAEMEHRLSDIEADIGVNDTQVIADLRRLQARLQAEHLLLKIEGELDPDIERKIRALEARLGSFRINVTGQVNRGDFAVIKKQIQALLGEVDANVDLQLSIDEAVANVEALNAELKRSGKLPVDVDLTEARRSLEVFRSIQEHNDIELPVDIDISSLDAALARMEAQSAASGGDSGDAFAKAFQSKSGDGFKLLPGQVKEWAPLIGVALGPAVQLLEGALGGALQVVSSAFSALGGAAGAATPIVAGLGAVMGAVVIGSLGMGKAIKASSEAFTEMEDTGTVSEATLKKVDKAMRNLTPAAREVAQEIAAMLPQFRNLQDIVSSHLFAGMGAELHSLSAETLPDLTAMFSLAADSANRFGKQMLDALRGIDFTGTFAAVQPAIDALGRAIANVVRAIEPFLKAAAPAARELANWIEEGSKSFLNMVRAGAGSGKITQFLLEGVSSLKDWARLIGAVGDALFTLFQAGKSGGDGMVKSLTDIVGKWDAWMESARGQKALSDFFATSRQLLSDLVPLIKGVADGIANIVTPAAGTSFRQLTTGLGDIARVAGELINVFNRMNITGTLVQAFSTFAKALEPVIPSLTRLADAIGVSLAHALQVATPFITTLASVIGTLADILVPLAPAIVAIGIAFAGWKIISSVMGFVNQAIEGVSKLGQQFSATQGAIEKFPQALTNVRAAFTDLQGPGITFADKVRSSFSELGTQLPALARGAAASAGVALASGLGIAFGAQMVSTGHGMSEKVTGVLTTIGSAVTAFATGGPIVGAASVGIGLIANAFMNSARKAEEAKAEVDDFAKALLKMRDGASDADAVNIVLDKLKGKGNDVRDAFQKMGLSVGDWADEVISGSKSAQQATADWLETIVGASDPLVEMVRSGKVSLGDLRAEFDLMNTDAGLATGAFAHLGDVLAENDISMQSAHGMFELLNDSQSQLGKGAEEAARQTFEAGSAMDKAADSGENAAAGFDAASDSATKEAEAAATAARQMADLESQLKNTEGTAKAASQGFDSISDAVFGIAGPMSAAEVAMAGVGKAADDAAKKADAFGEAMDKLISPKLDAAAALSAYKQGIDDISKSLEDNGRSLDLNNEKGRNNAEAIRSQIESIDAWGQAALANGVKQEDVNTMMQAMRDSLIEQVGAFDTAGQSAEEYINQLGLTPDNIRTIVETPGLLDATKQILSYDTDMDGIDDRVDTTFSANNLDLVKSALAEYGVDLSKVPDDVLTTFLQQNWQTVHDQAQTLATDAQTVTDTPATVQMSSTGADTVTGQIQAVAEGMFGIDNNPATATVSPEGIEQTNTDLATVDSNLNTVDGKTAKPQVELVNNLIVLAVLATITDEVKKLDGMKASPDVKIPNFGTVVGQTVVMTALLTQLGQQKPAPQVTLPTFPTVVGQVIVMNALIQQLGQLRAAPSVTLANYGAVIGQIVALGLAVAGLDRMSASVSVSAPGLNETINGFRTLNTLITQTNGRVATVTTRNVTINSTQQGMAGALITHPMNMNVGERGLREALIPLDLPLSRVNPNVRGMAEQLRGEGGTVSAGTILRQVNVTNNIEVSSSSADPVAIATQVINRAAAMAN